MPATHRRLTEDIELFNENTSFQLPATHRQPTADIEGKLKLFNFFAIAVPATSRTLYGNMTAVGRRWVAGSFRSLNGFNTTRNVFHFTFILKFSTEESSSLEGHRCVKSIWKHAFVAGGSPALESYMETRL